MDSFWDIHVHKICSSLFFDQFRYLIDLLYIFWSHYTITVFPAGVRIISQRENHMEGVLTELRSYRIKNIYRIAQNSTVQHCLGTEVITWIERQYGRA